MKRALQVVEVYEDIGGLKLMLFDLMRWRVDAIRFHCRSHFKIILSMQIIIC